SSGTFLEECLQPADYGLDFYAAQTMETSDGRRILIGWLATWACNWFTPEDGFSGMMTIPRELTLKEVPVLPGEKVLESSIELNGKGADGKRYVVCQKPVRELERYYTNPVEIRGKILSDTCETFDVLKGRVQNLELSLTGEKGALFELHFAAKGDTHTRLSYDFDRRELVYDRRNQGMTRDCENIRVVKVPGEGYRLDLQILLDLYSAEIFARGGEIVLTNVLRSPLDCEEVRLFANGMVQADILKHDICVK
nr:GH32 C-terminal domain-containing protein [Lachnospiraceae bacterium]